MQKKPVNLIKNIRQLYDETKGQIHIPNLQRDYVWTEIQWEQLWDDIYRVYHACRMKISENEQHFMGCLVIKYCNDCVEIIDGQQRFTTFKILIDYLKDLKAYLSKEQRNEEGYFTIHNEEHPVERDDSIMDTDSGNEKDIYTRAYNFFSSRYNDAPEEMELDFFTEIVETRMFFMVSVIEEDENDVFEAINATGKPLLYSDLLLNYLFELNKNDAQGMDEKTLRDRWNRIIARICESGYLEDEEEINALLLPAKVPQEEGDDESGTELSEWEADAQADEMEEETEEKAEEARNARISPLKFKKFLNALHCLTLPKTGGMRESVDAFEGIFLRFMAMDAAKQPLSASYIISQMEKWMHYYLLYFNPESCPVEACYREELFYLSLWQSSGLIPVFMRTLYKYAGRDDCAVRDIFYGINCGQLLKVLYIERDNGNTMDKKCILADFIYAYDKEAFLTRLIGNERIIGKLENDAKLLEAHRNGLEANDLELWKLPFYPKACKVVLSVDYAANHGCENVPARLKSCKADYLVAPEEDYAAFGFDGKSIGELWNVVLRAGIGDGDKDSKGTEHVSRQKADQKNRLIRIADSILAYCGRIMSQKADTGNVPKVYFARVYEKNGELFGIEGMDPSEGDRNISRAENDVSGKNIYFGFKGSDANSQLITYPEKVYGNNETIDYILNGESCIDSPDANNKKEQGLMAFYAEMCRHIGDEKVKKIISDMKYTQEKKIESPSNILFLTKELYSFYEKRKELQSSTKERWKKYLDIAGDAGGSGNEDRIVVNLNTGADVISRNLEKVYRRYEECAINQCGDYAFAFCLKMSRPEMHYIGGYRKITQYRNVADQKKYEEFVKRQEEEKKETLLRGDTAILPKADTPGELQECYFYAVQKSLEELMQEDGMKGFRIPEYQRAYVWTRENWSALLKSILERDKWNIGTVILFQKEDGNGLYIVDGQQRLTTLSVLWRRLEPSFACTLPDVPNAGKYFEDALTLMSGNSEEKRERLRRDLLGFLKKIRLNVLWIRCDNDLYQYRVFSSVNGKGVKLAVEDKVKNYLYKMERNKKRKIANNTKKKIKKVSSDKTFLKAVLEENKAEHISERNMYDVFKEYMEAGEVSVETLDQMQQIFSFMKKGNPQMGTYPKKAKSKEDLLKKEFWIWLKLYQHLKVDTADALILHILTRNGLDGELIKKLKNGNNLLQGDNLEKMNGLLRRIDMIYFLLYVDDLNGNGKKSINRKFPQLIRGEQSIKVQPEQTEPLIADDPMLLGENDDQTIMEHVFAKICETNLTRRMRPCVARFLLMILELWNGLEYDVAFEFLTDNEKGKSIRILEACDIEHIFPANPERKYEALNLHTPRYMYTLANVCLLESCINRAVSNSMLVVSPAEKVVPKLAYLDKKTSCSNILTYKDSRLTFPQMFYDKNGIDDDLAVRCNDGGSSFYYYSQENAENRLRRIQKSLMREGGLYGSMIKEIR